MKRIILTIFGVAMLLSCNTKRDKIEVKDETEADSLVNEGVINKIEKRIWEGDLVQKEGSYMYYKDERFTGLVFDLYDNNEIKIEYEMKGGLKNGGDKKWRRSGKMEFSNNIVNGKKHGLQERWYSNGVKQSKQNYSDGIKNGLFQEWYTNEILKYKCNYNNGNKSGFEIYYYENGNTKSKTSY